MNIDLILSAAELGGVGIALWFTYHGLKVRIDSLSESIRVKDETILAMEKRVSEAEKIGEMHKGHSVHLAEQFEEYKNVLLKSKDNLVKSLQEANNLKDAELKALTESRLDEIQKKEKILEEMPALQHDLVRILRRMETRMAVLDMLQPGSALRAFLVDFESWLQDVSDVPEQQLLMIEGQGNDLDNKGEDDVIDAKIEA